MGTKHPDRMIAVKLRREIPGHASTSLVQKCPAGYAHSLTRQAMLQAEILIACRYADNRKD